MITIPATLIATVLIIASPERPDIKPSPKAAPLPIPDLSGLTNWGLMEQSGRQLRLTGHPVWEAVGNIKANGEVYLLWTLLSNGQPAPSLYKVVEGIHGKELHGNWNYAENVTVDKDGKIEGLNRPDVVRKIPPVMPEIEQ
jgi:hypothetical protein